MMGPRFKGSKSSSKRWAYVEKYGRLLVAIAQSGSSSLSFSVREWMAFFIPFPSEVHCIGKNEAHVAFVPTFLSFFPDGAYGWKTDLSHPCHHCLTFPSLAPLFLGHSC